MKGSHQQATGYLSPRPVAGAGNSLMFVVVPCSHTETHCDCWSREGAGEALFAWPVSSIPAVVLRDRHYSLRPCSKTLKSDLRLRKYRQCWCNPGWSLTAHGPFPVCVAGDSVAVGKGGGSRWGRGLSLECLTDGK